VPALLVPDNTKVAVIKACLYDPVINKTSEMAAHYAGCVKTSAPCPGRRRPPFDIAVATGSSGAAHSRLRASCADDCA
jgi:hypothetical protein